MAVVAGEVDMGLKQQMANLNSLSGDALEELVPVFFLYTYLKLVVVDKGSTLVWKTGFFLFRTVIWSICKGVGVSACGLYPEHEQVPKSVLSCG